MQDYFTLMSEMYEGNLGKTRQLQPKVEVSRETEAELKMKQRMRRSTWEEDDQAALVLWCRGHRDWRIQQVQASLSELPYRALHYIKISQHQRKVAASQVKGWATRMGWIPGDPDLRWSIKSRQYGGLYIELKDPGGPSLTSEGKRRRGVVSPEQQERLDLLNRSGQFARACWGRAQAEKLIEWYFEIR